MSTEQLTIELSGDVSKQQVQSVLDGVGENQQITAFSIVVDTNGEAVLPELDTDETDPTSGTEDVGDSDESTDTTVRLQRDGDPFYVAQAMEADGGWMLAEDIEDALGEDTEVNLDSLSSTLYNLDDRGLVEKQPYEEDKRYKEYKLTDVGQSALADAKNR